MQSPDWPWISQAAASSELMQRLSSAKEALVKFNRLIFPNALGNTGSIVQDTMQSHSPAYRPGSSTQSTSTSPNSQSRNDSNSRRKELYVDNSLPPYVSQPPSYPVIPPVSESDVNEECCAGLFDCNDLCEDDSSVMLCRTSEIRSTTSIEWWS